jgi:hypothetical protein
MSAVFLMPAEAGLSGLDGFSFKKVFKKLKKIANPLNIGKKGFALGLPIPDKKKKKKKPATPAAIAAAQAKAQAKAAAKARAAALKADKAAKKRAAQLAARQKRMSKLTQAPTVVTRDTPVLIPTTVTSLVPTTTPAVSVPTVSTPTVISTPTLASQVMPMGLGPVSIRPGGAAPAWGFQRSPVYQARFGGLDAVRRDRVVRPPWGRRGQGRQAGARQLMRTPRVGDEDRPGWGFERSRNATRMALGGRAVRVQRGIEGLDGLSLKKLGKGIKKVGKKVGKALKKVAKPLAAVAVTAASLYAIGATGGAAGGVLAKMKAGLGILGNKAYKGLKAAKNGMSKLLGGQPVGSLTPQEIQQLQQANQQSGGAILPAEVSDVLKQVVITKLTGTATAPGAAAPGATSPGADTDLTTPDAGGAGGGGGNPFSKKDPSKPGEMPEWLLPVGIGAGALVLLMALRK